MNSNYEDFLGLGRDLRGREGGVEEVTLGVLGFRREVEGLRRKVVGKREEVEGLVERRKRVREEIVLGRGLLEVERRVSDLERRLMLMQDGVKEGNVEDPESDIESDDEVDELGVGRLKRHAEQYVYITKLVQRLGPEHPFLINQEERILRLKQTVLLDLGSTLKSAKNAVVGGQQSSTLQILRIYGTMNASKEAVSLLKEMKKQST